MLGMLRRGWKKADVHRLRKAYAALFFGDGTFRERIDAVARSYTGDILVAKVIDFIKSGSRPLTTAVHRPQLKMEA